MSLHRFAAYNHYSHTMPSMRTKLLGPLIVNITSVLLAAVGIGMLRSDDVYFRIGPHIDLKILSVAVDTWTRWWALVAFLSLMGLSDVLTEELADPILTFTIYNPDKKRIVEFGKNELQLFANLTYLTSSVKRVMLVLVQISQFDLAIVHVVVTELATVFTIRTLLNEKSFDSYARVSQNETCDD